MTWALPWLGWLFVGRRGYRPLGAVVVAAATAISATAIYTTTQGGGGGGASGVANLWVDTNGGTCTRSASPAAYSDAAACSGAAAASSAAQAGDTVAYESGDYGTQQLISGHCYSNWVTFTEGTGQTVTLHGGSSAGALGLRITDSCFVRVLGLEFTDGIRVDGTSDNVDIKNNYIHSATAPTVDSTWADISEYGIYLRVGEATGVAHVTIEGNTFKDIVWQCKNNGNDVNGCDSADNNPGYGYCVYDFRSITTTFTGNHIDRCWDDAYQAHAHEFTFTNNDIKNDWNPIGLTDTPTRHQDGIQIFAGTPGNGPLETIANNIFHGDMDTCVRIQNALVTNFLIYNNVCGGTIHGSGFDFENMNNSTVSFNTVLAQPTGILSPEFPSHDNLVENNIFSAFAIDGTNETVRNNIIANYTGNGIPCTSCTSVLPDFVNDAGEDWRLASGDPGINAGVNEAGVTSDVLGRQRPAPGGVSDIGAYERQAGDP